MNTGWQQQALFGDGSFYCLLAAGASHNEYKRDLPIFMAVTEAVLCIFNRAMQRSQYCCLHLESFVSFTSQLAPRLILFWEPKLRQSLAKVLSRYYTCFIFSCQACLHTSCHTTCQPPIHSRRLLCLRMLTSSKLWSQAETSKQNPLGTCESPESFVV